jgi:hypothetical protein
MDKPTFIFQLGQLDQDPAAALEEKWAITNIVQAP